MRLIKAVLDEMPVAPSLADKQHTKAQQQQLLLHLDSELISSDDKIPVGTLPAKGAARAVVGITPASTISSRGVSDAESTPPDSPKGTFVGGHENSSSSGSSSVSLKSSSSEGLLTEVAAVPESESGAAAAAAGVGAEDEVAVLDQQQLQGKQQLEMGLGGPLSDEDAGQAALENEPVVQQQQEQQQPLGKKGRKRRKPWYLFLWR
jgi:hypothetical protein